MSDCNCNDRRSFLKLGGMTLVLSALNPDFIKAAGDPRLERYRGLQASNKTFIHIWLRGGQDGLHVTVPTEAGEYALYQSYRPTLAVPMASLSPQTLTPDFALHPSTRTGLYDLFSRGMLSVLPTVGYEDSSRSHFDSQKFIEVGVPFNKTTPDGWLNRWLATAPAANPGDALRAVSFTSSIPFQMVGSAPVMSFTNLSALSVSTNPTRDAKYLDIQKDIYAMPGTRTYDPEIADAGLGLVAAIEAIRATTLPAPTVTYPTGSFGSSMSQLAQLIRAGAFSIEVANIEINSWDTHTTQGGVAGTFPGLLQQLSDGIRAFVDDLNNTSATLMDNVLLLTVSEFGRTARENGNGGTDHGNAWTSFVVGKNVNPGLHMGAGWPGLSNLRENRDLEFTIDFRDVYAEILSSHMGYLDPSVFPGFTPTPVGFL